MTLVLDTWSQAADEMPSSVNNSIEVASSRTMTTIVLNDLALHYSQKSLDYKKYVQYNFILIWNRNWWEHWFHKVQKSQSLMPHDCLKVYIYVPVSM